MSSIQPLGATPSTAKAWTSPDWTPGRSFDGKTSKALTLCKLSPPPPTPPWKWHATHEEALNTGPRPSPLAMGSCGCHSCSNSASPAALVAASARGPHRTGSPGENVHATTAAITTLPAIPTRFRPRLKMLPSIAAPPFSKAPGHHV